MWIVSLHSSGLIILTSFIIPLALENGFNLNLTRLVEAPSTRHTRRLLLTLQPLAPRAAPGVCQCGTPPCNTDSGVTLHPLPLALSPSFWCLSKLRLNDLSVKSENRLFWKLELKREMA